MSMRVLFPILACLFMAGPAAAAAVTITVKSTDGSALADAVVTIDSPATRPGTPPAFAYPARVAQKDIMFDPFVLVVPKGARVTFPNRDKVRHQVYSFSKAKKFELKLYGREEDRSMLFDVAGVVALGCNIHDRMSAYISVVDTPWAGKTDATGRLSIPDVPAGGAVITVWHPRARAKGNAFTANIAVPAKGDFGQVVTLAVSAR